MLLPGNSAYGHFMCLKFSLKCTSMGGHADCVYIRHKKKSLDSQWPMAEITIGTALTFQLRLILLFVSRGFLFVAPMRHKAITQAHLVYRTVIRMHQLYIWTSKLCLEPKQLVEGPNYQQLNAVEQGDTVGNHMSMIIALTNRVIPLPHLSE
ncbi:hypothetical protein MTR67_010357 [Solanum verrucosum]|uniref:Uncharacterized protein n=1 Tax=Solanum verrucosum TaxID=315347 RepID=A0AAF0TE52_SOLVR|nr:hypothetical protein MTR67_010357 [Solanum verrucosum]